MPAPPTFNGPTDPDYLRWRWQEWKAADADSAQAFYHNLLDQEEYERVNHDLLTRYGYRPGRARHLLQTLDLPIVEPCRPHPPVTAPTPAPTPRSGFKAAD